MQSLLKFSQKKLRAFFIICTLFLYLLPSFAYANGEEDTKSTEEDFTASISQSGEDKWYQGENVSVSWSSNVNDDDNEIFTTVTLQSTTGGENYTYCSDAYRLSNPNGYKTCTSSSSANSGSRSWEVGELLNGKHVPPGKYRAHVSIKQDFAIGDGASASTAEFEIVADDICIMNTIVSSGSGSVDPAHIEWTSGSRTVNFNPTEGWYVFRVKVNGFTLANSNGTLKHPTSHSESCNGSKTVNVEVEFRLIQCQMTVTHNSGGEVTLTKEVNGETIVLADSYVIPAGETVTAESTASMNYVIKEVYIEEKNVFTGNVSSETQGQGQEEFTRSFTCPNSTPIKSFKNNTTFELKEDCRVRTAAYTLDGFSGGGTVDPLGTTMIEKGDSETFHFNAEEGFEIGYVMVNGEDVNGDEDGGPSSQTINCNTGGEDYNVYVYFLPTPCKLTTKANDGGTITPNTEDSDPIDVRVNQYKSIAINPDFGYKVEDVRVNGESQGPVTSYNASCREPDTDIDVEAFFVWDGYTITSSVNGSGGEINPLGQVELAKSETQDFVITPDDEYVIEWVKIDGIIDTKYTHNADTTRITLGPDLTDDTPDRTIQVKFMLACKLITPEQTIANLRSGNPAQINESTFRTWVQKNEELVKTEIDYGQCEYVSSVSEADLSQIEVLISDLMHRNITNSIRPLTDEDKPALGGFYLLYEVEKRAESTNQLIERSYDNFAHAIVITELQTSVQKTSPPVTVYSIDYIDSTGPRTGSLNCEGTITGQGLGRVILCDIPGYYKNFINTEEVSGGIVTTVTAKRIYVVVQEAMANINLYELLPLNAVREDPSSWIEGNYTKISNYAIEESPQGVCLGWSKFNAGAAQLIKECPWNEGGDNKDAELGDK